MSKALIHVGTANTRVDTLPNANAVIDSCQSNTIAEVETLLP